MTIAMILKDKGPQVFSVSPGTPVREAVAVLARERVGCVTVMEDDAVVGIFSERDLIYRIHADGESVMDGPVSACMTAPAVTVSPDLEVLGALSLMTRRRLRHLPVVENGRIAGIVSIGDLVKHRIDKIESEAQSMRDYIARA